MIDPKLEILTERCRLRYPHLDDIPYVWSASRVSGFNDGMLWEPPEQIDELLAAYRRTTDAWGRGDAFTWSIDSIEANDFLGRISIRKEQREGEWSIGFWIHPDVQGRGYATEAAQAIVEFGLSTLRANIVSAAHATWNEASGQVLRQIGMKQVHLNPRGFKKNGEWVAEFEYEIHAGS